MTRIAAFALVAALLLAPASRASATALEDCCACIPATLGATTSGPPRANVEAAFCAEADGGNLASVSARCAALGPGYALVCLANIPGPTCQEQLADANIICPVAAAPAASPAALIAGLVLLSGLAALRLGHFPPGRRVL